MWIENKKLCPTLRRELKAEIESTRSRKGILARYRPFKGKRKVIVQLDSGQFRSLRNKSVLSKEIHCRVETCFPAISSFATRADDAALKRLVADPRVTGIWADREVKALLDTGVPVISGPRAWQLGYKGKGIGIAVLDTGCYPHPDLVQSRNRLIAFKDFTAAGRFRSCFKKDCYDDNGHGTHVAGDAAGNGGRSGGKYKAIAPEANIIAIRVLNKFGSGSDSQILQGIQWALDHRERYNIRVLSLSLGEDSDFSWKDDILCIALDTAWRRGVVVCAAAGNSGPAGRTIASPGNTPAILTVGAACDHGTVNPVKTTVARYSSRGPTADNLQKPDLVAPGTDIISLLSPASFLEKNQPAHKVGEDYFSLDGTSMATPICAGAAAILLEADPGLQPDEIKDILVSTCTDLGEDSNAQGAGLLNIEKALQKVFH